MTNAFNLKNLLVLSIATSIDAGYRSNFCIIEGKCSFAVMTIGIITFITSFIGVKLGHDLGSKCKSKAEILGGFILIAVGTKILLEHLGIIG